MYSIAWEALYGQTIFIQAPTNQIRGVKYLRILLIR